MSLILNPYNVGLDLGSKDDWKLFAEATRGLPEGQKFVSKKENLPDFAKLIGHLLGGFRLDEILKVAIDWEDATNAKDPLELVDIFVKKWTSLEK
eukprot:6956758-Ditylum_brightwellii.AAC.1